MIVVGTDGACAGNPGPAGWAWVVDEGRWQAGSLGAQTNNVAELEAILRVLVAAPSGVDLRILTDSEYALKAVTVWHKAWRRNGWKTRDGKPVKNRERIEAATDVIRLRTGRTEVQWVKGHADHPLNEAADRLAVKMRTEQPRQVLVVGPGFSRAAQ